MNINENKRNKRTITEILRGLPSKLPVSQLQTILSYLYFLSTLGISKVQNRQY